MKKGKEEKSPLPPAGANPGKELLQDKLPLVSEVGRMRQVIIETDGNNINLVKAEVSGTIELIGILRNLIEYLSRSK